MTEVFMPMDLLMEKAIIENADLIIENEMPKSFIDLIAHIAAYKPVMRKWQEGDFSEHLSVTNYPDDLPKYVEGSYVALKNERATLLGKLKHRMSSPRRKRRSKGQMPSRHTGDPIEGSIHHGKRARRT
jgi:hypothetical protein